MYRCTIRSNRSRVGSSATIRQPSTWCMTALVTHLSAKMCQQMRRRRPRISPIKSRVAPSLLRLTFLHRTNPAIKKEGDGRGRVEPCLCHHPPFLLHEYGNTYTAFAVNTGSTASTF